MIAPLTKSICFFFPLSGAGGGRKIMKENHKLRELRLPESWGFHQPAEQAQHTGTVGLGSRLTSANYPQRPFLPVERGLSFSLPLILLNWHQRLSPLAGPPVVVTVTAAPGFRSDDPPVFTSCGGVRKLCGSARFSVSLLSPTATKVYLIYSFSVGGVRVWGPRERWAMSWGVADRPIPSRWAFTCNSGTYVSPWGSVLWETGIWTKRSKHSEMGSTAIFEVEWSVTSIRCPPDSIHVFSVPIRRQEIVRLPLLLARGTKGSERQVEGHIFGLRLFLHDLLTPSFLTPPSIVREQGSCALLEQSGTARLRRTG